jgi:hypothetical protein
MASAVVTYLSELFNGGNAFLVLKIYTSSSLPPCCSKPSTGSFEQLTRCWWFLAAESSYQWCDISGLDGLNMIL